jgi:hypothetical protein
MMRGSEIGIRSSGSGFRVSPHGTMGLSQSLGSGIGLRVPGFSRSCGIGRASLRSELRVVGGIS